MPRRRGFSVAAAYCGAVIGAGFASGREVMSFFGKYGDMGRAGVIVATAMFMWAGVTILDVTHRSPVYSYQDLLSIVLRSPLLIKVADLLFLATLQVGTGVMIAAGGSLFSGWGVHYAAGCLIFSAVCCALLRTGSAGFLRANVWLVPGMIAVIIMLCLMQISHPALAVETGPWGAAVMYGAYNIAIAAVALSTLKPHLSSKAVWLGGLGGGLLTGGLLFLEYLALMQLPGQAEMPMLELAAAWLGAGKLLYEFALLAAVTTTALANMHGLAARIAGADKYRFALAAIGGLGFMLAQIGFAGLVDLLYPLLGICNIVLVAGLCYYSLARVLAAGKSRGGR